MHCPESRHGNHRATRCRRAAIPACVFPSPSRRETSATAYIARRVWSQGIRLAWRAAKHWRGSRQRSGGAANGSSPASRSSRNHRRFAPSPLGLLGRSWAVGQLSHRSGSAHVRDDHADLHGNRGPNRQSGGPIRRIRPISSFDPLRRDNWLGFEITLGQVSTLEI